MSWVGALHRGDGEDDAPAVNLLYHEIEDFIKKLNEIAEEVFNTVAKLDSTVAMLALLEEDIIPKSARTLLLSMEGYSIGKTEYFELIDSWRTLLKYRISKAELQSLRLQLLITLHRQIGGISHLETRHQFPPL